MSKAAKALPYLKKPCVTVVKLLCGSNVLLINTKCDLPRNERICELCDLNKVEDNIHFMFHCPKWSGMRKCIEDTIKLAMSEETYCYWSALSEEMKMFIALGLDYPFPLADLQAIRYIYCVNIHKMYKARKSMFK